MNPFTDAELIIVADVTRMLGHAVMNRLTPDQIRFLVEHQKMHALVQRHLYHSMLTSNLSADGDA